MPKIQLGSTLVSYEIKASNQRKTIGVIVDPKEGLNLRVPEETTSEEVETIIHKKSQWILKKLESINEIQPEPTPKELVSGERFQYIGRSYRLRVFKKAVEEPEIGYQKGKFVANVPQNMPRSIFEPILKEKLIDWYKKKALQKFTERIEYYSPRIGNKPVRIGVRDFQTQWGSIDNNGGINFNWRLVMAPMSIIDYAIVHELCHLVIPSHSKDFWRFLSVILVDFENRKEWLRINGTTLTL